MLINENNLSDFILILLTSCASTPQIQPNFVLVNKQNGILAVVINSEDHIGKITIKGLNVSHDIQLSTVQKGTFLRLYEVPEGEYCLRSFTAYGSSFQMEGKGLCRYIEADEINYFGHLIMRYPQITQIDRKTNFLSKLKIKYPKIYANYYE